MSQTHYLPDFLCYFLAFSFPFSALNLPLFTHYVDLSMYLSPGVR
jgi:hypothetical protein